MIILDALKIFDIDFDWRVNVYEDEDSFSEVTQPYYDAVFPEWWSVEGGLERFINAYTPYKP